MATQGRCDGLVEALIVIYNHIGVLSPGVHDHLVATAVSILYKLTTYQDHKGQHLALSKYRSISLAPLKLGQWWRKCKLWCRISGLRSHLMGQIHLTTDSDTSPGSDGV